jgi:hypothetical protein
MSITISRGFSMRETLPDFVAVLVKGHAKEKPCRVAAG